LIIERGAQVRAIDLRNRTRAANIGRDFAVAGFDLVAKNVPLLSYMTIGARFETHVHSSESNAEG